MTKLEAVQAVKNSVSSIFSTEDVINIINSIEGGGRVVSVYDIQRAIDNTISYIEDNSRDILDLDNAEFELCHGNRLEVTDVGINTEEIREALENNFMDFGEAEVEQDVVELERVDEERDDE
jgi:hypothetical protein